MLKLVIMGIVEAGTVENCIIKHAQAGAIHDEWQPVKFSLEAWQ